MRKSQSRSALRVSAAIAVLGALALDAGAQALPPPPPAPAPAPAAVSGMPLLPDAAAPAVGAANAVEPSTPEPTVAAFPEGPAKDVGPAGDPADAMTVDGSDGVIASINGMSEKRLDGLAAASVPADNKELTDRIMHEERGIRLLEKQKERAKLAVEVWGILHENDYAKTARQDAAQKAERLAIAEASAAEAQRKVEAQNGKVSASAGGAASALAAPDVASMLPVVAEVNGSKALLLVPGQGQMVVSSGARLANGMRVRDVSLAGVTVVDAAGKPAVLGFGTSVGTGAAR